MHVCSSLYLPSLPPSFPPSFPPYLRRKAILQPAGLQAVGNHQTRPKIQGHLQGGREGGREGGKEGGRFE